ncbi:MAG: radical SAM protein [Rhodospirillales bacterium]|nr:radical SAM protein [Rhodospirillales bacterium]
MAKQAESESAVVDTPDRHVPEYMASHGQETVEQKLLRNQVPKFGQKFADYRAEYLRSLNYDKEDYVAGFPITLNIELVNRCNLSCIMCYTINHKGEKHTLSLDQMRGMAKEIKAHNLPAMIVGLGSEALLYKDFKNVLDICLEAGVMDLILYTNGVLLTRETSEYLVRSGISRIHVSLDAATPETYVKIRGKPELDRIEKNIETFLEVRKSLGSELPILRVAFCVQAENLHEREAFRKKWEGKADRVDFQLMAPEKHVDDVKNATPDLAKKVGFFHKELLDKPWCSMPFNSLSVWADGGVTPCCSFMGKNLTLGNIKESSLEEIWRGEKIEKLRNEFRTGKLNPSCELCISGRDLDSFRKQLED